MKVAVAFALVAACIAATYSAPAPQAVDWTAVGTKVGEIEALVRFAVQTIKERANRDNAAIGSQIGNKLDAAAVRATAILQQASDKIRDQSLTEAQARELLGQLKDLLAGLQQDLQTELAQLSAGAASDIRDTFYTTYAKAEELAQQLYALLSAFAPAAVNWVDVAHKVREIECEVTLAVLKIKDIANGDNAVVGRQITEQVDHALEQARTVLVQIEARIRDGTLVEEWARLYLGFLKDILAGVQGDLQDELAQLSPGAAGDIRDLFYVTYAKAEEKSQELFELLRQ